MRILWIASSFPPINVSSSIRLLNYVNIAARLGHECDVVTVDYPADHVRRDDRLLQQIKTKVRVFRYSPGPLYMASYPRASRLGSQTGDGNRKKILKAIAKKYIAIPDTLCEAIPRAARLVRALMRENRYDLIFSAHEPPSNHLIAYFALRHQSPTRWIAYWSDPWTGNIKREHLPPMRQWAERQIEKKIIHKAKKLLFTSMATIDQYRTMFSIDASKCAIAFRGYDASQIRKLSAETRPKGMTNTKLPIVYCGSIFSGLRDLSPFIAAVTEIVTVQPDFCKYAQFYFVGDIADDNIKAKLGELGCVTMTGLLPYDEAMRYVAHAKLLLFWGNKKSTQIPGKIYEYIGTTSPILSIVGGAGDPSIELLQKINKGPIVPNSKDEILKSILNTVSLIRNEQLPPSWLKCAEEYEWENVVEQLLFVMSA